MAILDALRAAPVPAAPADKGELPPLPNCPEPAHTWTALERQAIEAYGQACILADRARQAAIAQPSGVVAYAPPEGWVVRRAAPHIDVDDEENDRVLGVAMECGFAYDGYGSFDCHAHEIIAFAKALAAAPQPPAGTVKDDSRPVVWAFDRPDEPYKYFTTDPERDNLRPEKLIALYTHPATASGKFDPRIASAFASLRWMLNKSATDDMPDISATDLLDKTHDKSGHTIRQDLEFLWEHAPAIATSSKPSTGSISDDIGFVGVLGQYSMDVKHGKGISATLPLTQYIDLWHAALIDAACKERGGDALDAARWRMLERGIASRLPGPAHGTRLRVVSISPTYGDETQVPDLCAAIDAAIATTKAAK